MKKIFLISLLLYIPISLLYATTVYVSQTFGYNQIDATTNIQDAINSSYDTIVVDYVGTDWIVKPLYAKSNKVVIFQSGVVLMAKQGEFKEPRTSLFNITNVSNVTLLGYGAIFRMRKSEYQDVNLYTPSEWRHALDIQAYVGMPVENIVIKGIHFEKSGGDGICISGISGYPNSDPVQPKNILIQDVVCDDNHRQGISVTGGENVKIMNSVLQNTRGTAPEAGMDWEPDWERLVNVGMTNCYFFNNRIKGIEMHLYRPAWRGSKTISLTFDNCHVDSDTGVQGIALGISHIYDIGGSDGNIIFNDCSFRNKTIYSTASMTDKSALKARVTMNRCWFEQTNLNGNVISLETNEPTIKNEMTFGGIDFNDCIVNYKADKNFISFVDNSLTGKGIRDIKGSVTVNNPISAKYDWGSVAQNINLAVTHNKTTAPSVNFTQPTILQKIMKGNTLSVNALASDSDVGTSNGAGISKVIFEVQYNNTKVFTTEVTTAPYSLQIPTDGWETGIYMVKAIAVSSYLNTKNITVIPVEIENTVTVLPITLINFSGTQSNNGNQLNWKTASEKNNSHFDLERSEDGKRFEKIITIKANGNTNAQQSYSYLDKASPFEITYYRLKQVDIDGKFNYSNTIAVQSDYEEKFSLYPNPFKDEINVVVSDDFKNDTKVYLYDMFGRIQNIPFTINETYINLKTNNLPVGNYVLKVVNGEAIFNKVIIKN